MSARVLSIGQCTADATLLEKFFSALGAEVVAVADESEARAALRDQRFELVLGNRVFDSDGASGIHVLASLLKLKSETPPIFMLISNYEDAQSEALACGLERGFGKGELRSEELKKRLQNLLRKSQCST